MDTINWDENRFVAITSKLGHFIKQLNFKEADVTYVPCSGLSGENLTEPSELNELKWYKGKTLVQSIGMSEDFTFPDLFYVEYILFNNKIMSICSLTIEKKMQSLCLR